MELDSSEARLEEGWLQLAGEGEGGVTSWGAEGQAGPGSNGAASHFPWLPRGLFPSDTKALQHGSHL